jgi:hypothetical protein
MAGFIHSSKAGILEQLEPAGIPVFGGSSLAWLVRDQRCSGRIRIAEIGSSGLIAIGSLRRKFKWPKRQTASSLTMKPFHFPEILCRGRNLNAVLTR